MASRINAFFLSAILLFCVTTSRAQQCPDDDPTLTPWQPGNQPTLDVEINNQGFLLTESAELRSITITNNGRLVIDDAGPGSRITLRVRHIVIENGGEFHVGAETCPYLGNLEIILFGSMGDGDPSVPSYGRKFIGCGPGGTIEIHGAPKLSWTQLSATLQAGQGLPGNTTIIDLVDDVTDWQTGNPKIVIATSDYDFEHTEVFSTVDCPACTANQVMIEGVPQYTHWGEITDGIDMRAEVGLLTRNVVLRGEVQDSCYGNNELCPHFPDRDIYGGHTRVLEGFTAAHFSDFELVDMGQMILGSYPIHWHRAMVAYGSYARRLSIHHSSSRCVTIHSTNGATVEDVVGYDVLGHCFFLEDGNEVNNTLSHNLGLVTRSGGLLPSDRDEAACLDLLSAVEPGYIPDPEKECRSVSSFWITHPENTVVDNAAAGSEEFGFTYIFHREPTGPSEGLLPPFHSERSPMTLFSNNRAHSNSRGGLILEKGVKINAANATDPREFLAIDDYAKYSPHENRDLYQPRVPAIIGGFNSYKNYQGMRIKGGDILVQDSSSADDTIGLTFLSDPELPYDIGSHQEVIRTTFIGQTANFRESYVHSFPQRGVEFRDGPVVVDTCTFTNYIADSSRNVSSALSFYPQYMGQFSTQNVVRGLVFTDASLRLWTGAPGAPGYGSYDADGDQTQILFDEDGSLSGDAQAYLVRSDKDIMSTGCRPEPTFGASVCPSGQDFGQFYFYQVGTIPMRMIVEDRDGSTVSPFDLGGVVIYDRTTGVFDEYSYQPVLATGRSYNIHWNDTAPQNLIVAPHNFVTGNSVMLALCYPPGTTFDVNYAEYDQINNVVTYIEPMTQGFSVADVANDPTGRTYFWDEPRRLMHIKSVKEFSTTGYHYCADVGNDIRCQGIGITATIINPEISDCRAP